jgi:hypothetical protein
MLGVFLPKGETAMRCDEARELIAAGQSSRLGMYYPEATAVTDEVDLHTAYCGDCRAVLERALWRRFWRRPGPLALWRTRMTFRYLHDTVEQYSKRNYAPIQRVANVLIQEAIKKGASEVELRMMAVADIDRSAVPPEDGGKPAGEGPTGGIMDMMRQDIAKACFIPEDGLAVLVRNHIGGEWKTQRVIPAYLADALWARYKSMANVRVSDKTIPQQGHVDISYEGNGYDVDVSTTPGELIETILIRIHAKAALAA